MVGGRRWVMEVMAVTALVSASAGSAAAVPSLDADSEPTDAVCSVDPAGLSPRIPHEPITITENAGPNGFILGADPVTGEPIYRPGSGVTSGTGTADDPYVIEGWCIGLGDLYPGPGGSHLTIPPLEEVPLLIMNTDAHVVVRNNALQGMFAPGVHLGCYHGLRSSGLGPDGWPCDDGGVANVTLEGNRIGSAGIAGSPGHALGLLNSQRITVEGNSLWGHVGISVTNTHGSTISGNTIVPDSTFPTRMRTFGIWIAASSDVTITRNNITAKRNGLLFSEDSWMVPATGGPENITVTENEISAPNVPIYLLRLTTWENSVVHFNNVDTPGPQALSSFQSASDLNADLRFNWWGCAEGVSPDRSSDCPITWGGGVGSRHIVEPWLTEPHVPGEILPWPFEGFFDPVQNPPSVNEVRAGGSVPIKFSLGGDRGLDVVEAGSPASRATDCGTGAPLGAYEEAASAGGSGLQYDDGQYRYVWQTQASWAGDCREFLLELTDGTEHLAHFRFR